MEMKASIICNHKKEVAIVTECEECGKKLLEDLKQELKKL